MTPKGKLILIGGHEDKGKVPGENLTIHRRNQTRSRFEILGMLISNIPREHHKIEIIAAASSSEHEVEELYAESYKRAGFTEVGFIKVHNKQDANDSDSIQRIQNAHAVFFAGGDQNKLVALLARTELLAAIRKNYMADQHFIVGGTSAGAMAMAEVIIGGGIIAEALYSGNLKTGEGLDLIREVIVDTHFIKRGRFARLAHAVAINPTCLGIGLEEDTAVIITEGRKVECIGSGMVVMIDGSKIGITNINEVTSSDPITIENLQVSILAEGSHYWLNDRKVHGNPAGTHAQVRHAEKV